MLIQSGTCSKEWYFDTLQTTHLIIIIIATMLLTNIAQWISFCHGPLLLSRLPKTFPSSNCTFSSTFQVACIMHTLAPPVLFSPSSQQQLKQLYMTLLLMLTPLSQEYILATFPSSVQICAVRKKHNYLLMTLEHTSPTTAHPN